MAFSSSSKMIGEHERIGAVDACQHRRAFHHRQHFLRHVLDDLVGIAIGEDAGERAAPRHAVAPRIIDDDEIDAAFFLALGGKASAGATADDRFLARNHAVEFFKELRAFKAGHETSFHYLVVGSDGCRCEGCVH